MIGMKVEDCLDGDTNFISWNTRILLILEENGFSRLNTEHMIVWKNKRPGLFLEDSLKKRELTMMTHFLLWLDKIPSEPSLLLLQLWDGICIRLM